MQSGENLVGKSIVSLTDGRVIGTVKELYIDRNLERLTAVQVSSGEGFLNKLGTEGLFDRKNAWIPRERVSVFGIDTILVTDEEVISEAGEEAEPEPAPEIEAEPALDTGLEAEVVPAPEPEAEAVPEPEPEPAPVSPTENWLQRSALRGRKVDTPGGTKIGTIGDIVVNEEGRIVGFLLSQIFVQGPVAAARAIARDVVVDTGNDDGVMTVDLSQAEQQGLMASQVGKRTNKS